MLLFQIVPTGPPHPSQPQIKILASTDVYSMSELEFWKGRHWAVIDRDGKFLVRNIQSTYRIDRSLEPHYGPRWTFTPVEPGRAVFYFSGITPTKSSTTIKFTDDIKFVEFLNKRNGKIGKRIDQHCVHGTWKGSDFKLEWREVLQVDTSSELVLSYRNKRQVLGTIPGWTGVHPIWIGDLNGDGQLDLLISSESDKGFGNLTFYLGIDDPSNLLSIAFSENSVGE